jgi:ATP-binding cassette, subfamily G (WHITE), member 2, PDR
MFLCWWFPIGLYNNTSVTDTTDSRATLAFLFVCAYMLHVSTFSDFMIAGITSAETASNVANVLGFIMLLFCGILASPTFMPGFWKFMYRCNPFTYLTEGLLASGLSRAPAECASNEWLRFEPPTNQSCGEYMFEHIKAAGGQLLDPEGTQICQFCPIADTDTFLSAVGVEYDNRWRDWGVMWAFIIFNMAAAVFLYWLLRVPKKTRGTKSASTSTGSDTNWKTADVENAISPMSSRTSATNSATQTGTSTPTRVV